MSENIFEKLNLTNDEAEKLTNAFKNDEFKKMFYDYCQEIQNPENMKLYENEIKQLESQRGIDIKFLYPESGFVLKTSINGNMKAFINVSKCSKIDKPKYEMATTTKTPNVNNFDENSDIERKNCGIICNLPYAQAPERHDYDNKGKKCMVYDVLFNDEAHELATKKLYFKKYMIQTACDGIEREFKVHLDLSNMKILKNLKYKGIPRPIVTRTRLNPTELGKGNNDNSDDENETREIIEDKKEQINFIDKILPPLSDDNLKRNENKPKIYVNNSDSTENNVNVVEKYAIPKYKIKYRNDIDLSEMTYELDAKLNLTIPNELIIEIELPLLNTTENCELDTVNDMLYLKCDKPAKYKIENKLPYKIIDKNAIAKFDKIKRKLIVQLPVDRSQKDKKFDDLMKEKNYNNQEKFQKNDDVKVSKNLVTEICDVQNVNDSNDYNDDYDGGDDDDVQRNIEPNEIINTDSLENFLNNSIYYNFPDNFNCKRVKDDKLIFILYAKNVMPTSMEYVNGKKWIQIKFTSLGNGFYPRNYGFYVEFKSRCDGKEDREDDKNKSKIDEDYGSLKISDINTEISDNNVILMLQLNKIKNLKYYLIGSNKNDDLKEYEIERINEITEKKLCTKESELKVK